ncbi:hypothetical protein [Cognatilysobacter segetis]|uniref:hypothetical protein n=1 Tax=Cognatilysobacter segetis TaxID=2492394 RepID=UPI00105F7911|nr:hypothetical protein [Lysobacter segetis]
MTRPLVLAVPIGLLLAACSRPPGAGGAAAAVRCDAAGAANAVFIEIAYAPDGMPVATPDTCSVARGTDVEWRGPDGTPQAFEIRFKRGNAMPASPEGRVHSAAAGARQVARGRADAAPGRYDYAIRSGSKERDPAIIIR